METIGRNMETSTIGGYCPRICPKVTVRPAKKMPSDTEEKVIADDIKSCKTQEFLCKRKSLNCIIIRHSLRNERLKGA